MALKFLNKKGWHTGSLRNIENVWKAEQKHDAEQKKLEELRKQIQEERERSEFRLLQEQAGLVPKQERLDFLYDSGLAVGKGSSEGFKALEVPKTQTDTPSSSSAKQQQQQQQPLVPGALFEEKPQSANDTWRKLHSDPLLLIRQREQEALARIKNNPVQMAMIRKTVKGKEDKEKSPDRKERHKKHHHKKSKHHKNSSPKHHYDSEDVEEEERRTSNKGKSSKYDDRLRKAALSSEELRERDIRGKKNSDNDLKYKEPLPTDSSDPTTGQSEDKYRTKRINDKSKREKYYLEGRKDSESARKGREDRSFSQASRNKSPDVAPQDESHKKRRNIPPKLSDEERALRLREMQMDAELHEEQRWKRLKKAEEEDAQEASCARVSSGRNFLDAAHKSVYGAEKGGSSTIEESVRRRKYYLQGRSEAGEHNAFRR